MKTLLKTLTALTLGLAAAGGARPRRGRRSP